MSQTPTLGRVVHYRLSEGDVDNVLAFRADKDYFVGNGVSEGQTYPAQVVATFNGGASCNLVVTLDGKDTLWVTSRPEGDTPGTWTWPPRVETTQS